ncbi:hypothetical protein N7535_004116 [Penicillium sp. DV-2018c]|nr:hypothetical protein N7461_000178 [Penicillium sp. DV-2018c]KAJ5577190.1 hypothetical protein N7535_004116 [Penicillium sp. DV-2018c]
MTSTHHATGVTGRDQNNKRQRSDSFDARIQRLEKAAHAARETSLLLQQEIETLQAEREQKRQKMAEEEREEEEKRKEEEKLAEDDAHISRGDIVVTGAEARARIKYLALRRKEQPGKPIPVPAEDPARVPALLVPRRAPPTCSGCREKGHTVRNCPSA